MTYLPQLQRILIEGAARLEDSAQAAQGTGGVRRVLAGVRRLARRKLFIPASVAILLTASGAVALAVVESRPSAPPDGRLAPPSGVPGTQGEPTPESYRIIATPDLNGGAVGWCLNESLEYAQGSSRTGACGEVALPGRPIIATDSGYASSLIGAPGELRGRAHHVSVSYETITDVIFMTAANVAAVRVSADLTIETRPDAQLPDGYRIAVGIHESITRQHRPAPGARPTQPSYPPLPTTRFAVALNATGHRIGAAQTPAPTFSDQAAFWQAQPENGVGPTPIVHAPPAGACEINTTALVHAKLFFGSVVKHVHGFPQLAGKTFLSCAETQFGYRGGVDAAILLDAQQPGALPEALPDTTPVPGRAGIVNESAADIGQREALTARRIGKAWLVIDATGTLAHRIDVLDRLTTCVKLAATLCSPPS